ncbi:MAG: hypothetical protein PHG00_09480 [Methylococcales bacterium]|nr:hypothetical protein [Methylococcales bacterium]
MNSNNSKTKPELKFTNLKTANAAMGAEPRIVTVPACTNHYGLLTTTVKLHWLCPVCGEPRGDTFRSLSDDGALPVRFDSWNNPCGHFDLYSDVRQEADRNGLNETCQNSDTATPHKENDFKQNPHRQHLPELKRRYRTVKGSFEMLTVFETPNAKSAAAMVEDAQLLLEAAKKLQASLLAMEGGQ